jgi:predicted Zn-dependent protease with MMP-like domain
LREQRRGDLTAARYRREPRTGGFDTPRFAAVDACQHCVSATVWRAGGGAPAPRRRYAHTVSSPDRARRRPGSPSHRDRRDRHGRGLRGRLVPANVPLFRTKSEIFDDLVLDAIEGLERTYSRELAGVEFAVEDVPPDLNVYDSDVLEDGEVPLARLLPGAPGRPNTPARIVLYRRPLEFRAIDNEDLADLVHDVIIEQVANLLGIDPEEMD